MSTCNLAGLLPRLPTAKSSNSLKAIFEEFAGPAVLHAAAEVRSQSHHRDNVAVVRRRALRRHRVLDPMAFVSVVAALQFGSPSPRQATRTPPQRPAPPKRLRARTASAPRPLTLSPLPPLPLIPTESPSPPPSPPVTHPHPPARPPTRRKPHGYWNDISNLENELRLINSQLGRAGRRTIPRLADISSLGRGDVVAAIAKHGGVKHIAAALRWTRAPREKPSSSLSSSTSPTSSSASSARAIRPVRGKVCRRPVHYWQSPERLHAEILGFIDEFGVRGVMPTRKQFYVFDRADLANAAAKHGGLRETARRMGLQARKSAYPRGYWRDFERVKRVLLQFADIHCPGVMPTADELSAKGLSAVVNAVPLHGGFPVVAEKCGLFPRNAKKQGAPKIWDETRLGQEYMSFLETYYPELAEKGMMVGERQLREHGRNDISYAIGKFGGFSSLGERLGLRKRVFRNIPGGGAKKSSKPKSRQGRIAQ